MAWHRVEKGELGRWLRIVAGETEPGVAPVRVPAHIAEALRTLRCIDAGVDGAWRITEKGKLALRMEEPGAAHLH